MSVDYSGKSKIIAIAGSGNAGQHIIEALLPAGFRVVLLLRKENPKLVEELATFIPEPKTPDVLVAEMVDFTKQDQLASALKKHHVDTVISVVWLPNPSDWNVEENLLNAAVEAGVRRFAPSNFAGPVEESHPIRVYEFKRRITALVANAPISYTHFTTGIFMNYFGTNAPPQGGKTALGHLRSGVFVVDVEKATATIAGTGDIALGFTEIHDVGRGVMAACSLESTWTPKTGWMAGDIMSYSDVVKIAEEVRGRKFEIQHLSLTELDALCVPKDDNLLSTFIYEAMRVFATPSAIGDVNHLKVALAKEGKENLYRPIGVRDFIQKWWGSTS